MDLSGRIITFKKFENEQAATKYFSRLSAVYGKQIEFISIYPKGMGVYYHFYFDRSKMALLSDGKMPASPEPVEGEEIKKKKTRKKRKKKIINE